MSRTCACEVNAVINYSRHRSLLSHCEHLHKKKIMNVYKVTTFYHACSTHGASLAQRSTVLQYTVKLQVNTHNTFTMLNLFW